MSQQLSLDLDEEDVDYKSLYQKDVLIQKFLGTFKGYQQSDNFRCEEHLCITLKCYIFGSSSGTFKAASRWKNKIGVWTNWDLDGSFEIIPDEQISFSFFVEKETLIGLNEYSGKEYKYENEKRQSFKAKVTFTKNRELALQWPFGRVVEDAMSKKEITWLIQNEPTGRYWTPNYEKKFEELKEKRKAKTKNFVQKLLQFTYLPNDYAEPDE